MFPRCRTNLELLQFARKENLDAKEQFAAMDAMTNFGAATNFDLRRYESRFEAFEAQQETQRVKVFDGLMSTDNADKAISKENDRLESVLDAVIAAVAGSILVWPFKGANRETALK